MRILVKIRRVNLDFVGYVEILVKFGAQLDFKVGGLGTLWFLELVLGFRVFGTRF